MQGIDDDLLDEPDDERLELVYVLALSLSLAPGAVAVEVKEYEAGLFISLEQLGRDGATEIDQLRAVLPFAALLDVSLHRLTGPVVLRLEVDPVLAIFAVHKVKHLMNERFDGEARILGAVLGQEEER